ncbi:hypothetical protein niasHT_005871 [Heterodera trifolii]|uniref:Uncharacterized protein n=1 Tax=Heterodera trifolii TaxID=157864 RepID=A0ABD2LYH0_9BILA
MSRRWICSDVWMDILPSFDRPQLGLKMALLSDRFDVLVDKHFNGKKELTIWRWITISKDTEGPKAHDIGPKAKLSVRLDGKWVQFPMPDRPLPNKIRLNFLQISVIWPVFATNIRHLSLTRHDHLDDLRRRTSPTILTDLDQLNSIESLLPDVISNDGPNATAGQALSKWLHTPSKDGQPKRLYCWSRNESQTKEWINNFKETFLRANTSSSNIIQIVFYMTTKPTEPFEVVNERTNEKLILWKKSKYNWLLKRCPIIVGETATIQWKDENWDDNLNNVKFNLWRGINSIGPLFPPAREEKEKADESNQNYDDEGLGNALIKELEAGENAEIAQQFFRRIGARREAFRKRDMTGNSIRKVLVHADQMEALFETEWAKTICQTMAHLGKIQIFTKAQLLSPGDLDGLETAIDQFKAFLDEQPMVRTLLSKKTKAHLLLHHFVPFARQHKFLGLLDEQGDEALHSVWRRLEQLWKTMPDAEQMRQQLEHHFVSNWLMDTGRLDELKLREEERREQAAEDKTNEESDQDADIDVVD